MVPLAQFLSELQQPGETVGPLEAGAALAIEVARLRVQVGAGEALPERCDRLGREGRVGKGAGKARQQPVAVHRGVPVEAAVKGRRELARRRDVGIAVEHVADLVGIFLVNAGESERGETFGGGEREIGHGIWLR